MTPEEEKVVDARTRLRQLEHAVTEAQDAVDRAPTDEGAQRKLEMTIAIRDVGRTELAAAEGALGRPLTADRT